MRLVYIVSFGQSGLHSETRLKGEKERERKGRREGRSLMPRRHLRTAREAEESSLSLYGLNAGHRQHEGKRKVLKEGATS